MAFWNKKEETDIPVEEEVVIAEITAPSEYADKLIGIASTYEIRWKVLSDDDDTKTIQVALPKEGLDKAINFATGKAKFFCKF